MSGVWTWELDTSDPTAQTLTVWDPNGESAGTKTQESWTWAGQYPSAVTDLMPETVEALFAIQRENIERKGAGDE